MPEPRIVLDLPPPPKKYPAPVSVRVQLAPGTPLSTQPILNPFDAPPPKKAWPNESYGQPWSIFALAQISLAQLQTEFDAPGIPKKYWSEPQPAPNVGLLYPPPPPPTFPLNAADYLFDLLPPKSTQFALLFDDWTQGFPAITPVIIPITILFDARYVIHLGPREFTVSIPQVSISDNVL